MVDYRGVTPKGSGYQAQAIGSGGYLGWRPTKRQAALLVAKKTKASLSEIRILKVMHPKKPSRTSTSKGMRPLRTHRWIYWLAGRGVWQVKLPNRTSFTAHTLPMAIEKAGKILRIDPNSFKLKAPCAQDHGRSSVQCHIRRVFRMVWGAYKGGPKQGKHKFACIPADAAYTYKYLRGPKAKPAEDPGMVFHYLMAKDGPGKEAVSYAMGKVDPKTKDFEELDYNTLALALKYHSESHDPKESARWSKGPGKGQEFKMGLRMWAQRSLKILKEGKGKGSIPFGKERCPHMIAPLTKAVRSKLRKTRAYGEALLKVRHSKLTDLKDWIKATKTLAKAAKGVPGLSGGTRSYFFLWSTRQWLDRQMRLRNNWKGLRYPPKTTVRQLIHSFPDQSRLLTKLCGDHKGLCKITVRELCAILGYNAPIEHLTMHTCLCLTPKIRQVMHTALAGMKKPITTKLERAITKKLEKVRKVCTTMSKHGVPIPPHPSLTVAVAMKSIVA